MASVNISLKQEAYQRLLSIKGPNESFSDEVLRLVENKRSTGADLLECFKMMKGISKESELEFEEGVKSARMSMQKILKKTKDLEKD